MFVTTYVNVKLAGAVCCVVGLAVFVKDIAGCKTLTVAVAVAETLTAAWSTPVAVATFVVFAVRVWLTVVTFEAPAAKTLPVKIGEAKTLSVKLTVSGMSPVLVTVYVYVTDVPFSTFVALGVLVNVMAG